MCVYWYFALGIAAGAVTAILISYIYHKKYYKKNNSLDIDVLIASVVSLITFSGMIFTSGMWHYLSLGAFVSCWFWLVGIMLFHPTHPKLFP